MRKSLALASLLLLVPAIAHAALAQTASEPAKAIEPPHYFHLDFVVQEVDASGKPTNSRSYSTTVSTDPRDSPTIIRAGSRIPLITGSDKGGGGQQYQYIDIGVNIDARSAHEVGRMLALNVSAEISSVAAKVNFPGPDSLITSGDPVIRQNKWQSYVLVPTGKATVIFDSDNLEDKGKMQLVITATPLQ
jgi:hypothetical protein